MSWGDLDPFEETYRDHPMYEELDDLRFRAMKAARKLKRDLARAPVFVGYLGQRLNEGTFGDLLRDMLARERAKEPAA